MMLCLLGPAWGVLQSQHSLGIWHLRHISGELDLKGQYRQLESSFNELTEDQKSTYLLSGLKLNTSSYLWDKDIFMIDLSGAYSPELRDEKYITVPDRSEVRTLKKVDLMATLFNNKAVTLQGFYNFDQSYFNRELLTNVRSNNQQWGGILSLNNRFLPLSLSYRNQKWDQDELQTGRIFNMDQESFQARSSKSFGSKDRTELLFSHNNYLYRYAELHQTSHLIDRFALNNNLFFDEARKYNLNSRFSWYRQDGTTSFRRLELLEGLTLRLPGHFKFRANLNLYQLRDQVQTWNQRKIRTSLEHKLYKSLTTRIFVDYTRIRQEAANLYIQSDTRGGLELKYSKRIPGGIFNLNYRYFRQEYSSEGEQGVLQVLNEPLVLSDGEIRLLKMPYAELSSVLVKDLTGTIIYQANFDYFLIERGSYVEIQRIPGGLIPNNGEVYVDYSYIQPGSYSYGANNNHLSAGILLFKRLLELYYSYSVQNYPRVRQGDLLTLNFYKQHVYGLRFDLGFARAGVEADQYDSNIVPYKMMRYYLDLNWNYKSKLLFTLNGSLRDYQMIADQVDQLYGNLSGKVAYQIRPRMRVSLETGYLNQRGPNIELDLLTSRAEFLASFNKLQFRIGMELYRRLYLNSQFDFNGAYVQLTRRF